MEKEQPINDWSYNEALSVALLRDEQQKAVQETQILIHLEKFGRQPNSGIPLFDAFIDIGCPCRKCFRDDFL